MTTIKGLDQLLTKLKTIENVQIAMHPPMAKSLSFVHDDLARYPRKAKGAFSSLAKPAQKRAFWAKVGKGTIDFREGVGYVRTGTTGRKWTSQIKASGTGIRGIVGNNEPGAFFAQDVSSTPPGQQPFHAASGWVTNEGALKKNEAKIKREFEIAFKKVLG